MVSQRWASTCCIEQEYVLEIKNRKVQLIIQFDYIHPRIWAVYTEPYWVT